MFSWYWLGGDEALSLPLSTGVFTLILSKSSFCKSRHAQRAGGEGRWGAACGPRATLICQTRLGAELGAHLSRRLCASLGNSDRL